MTKLIGFIIFIVYYWSCNNYFGNNWFPKSAEEAICDGIATIAAILLLMGGNDD